MKPVLLATFKDFLHDYILTDKFYHFALAVGIAVCGLLAARIIRFLLNRYFDAASKALLVNPTQYRFLKNAVTFMVMFFTVVAIFFSIPDLRELGVAVFGGAGLVAAFIGLAGKSSMGNIIAGVFVVIFKPFRVGDVIQVGNLPSGKVEDITLRHTVIRNFENRMIIIPNSVISADTIINSTIIETETCGFFEIPLRYDVDLEKAKAIVREEVLAHENYLDRRTPEDIENGDPDLRFRLIAFGEYAITLRAYLWAETSAKTFAMQCDIREILLRRFKEEGIEIPHPIRNIIQRNTATDKG